MLLEGVPPSDAGGGITIILLGITKIVFCIYHRY